MKRKAVCTDPTWGGRADCARCAIRNRVLFADLPLDKLNEVLQEIDDLVYAPNQSLYRIGEKAHELYTIRRGVVKLVCFLRDGTERIVRLLTAGDVVGIEVIIGLGYNHTAITLSETEVCRIPLAVVEQLDLQSPLLARQLMLRWQKSLDDADRALVEFSTGAAEARVAHLLLYLSSLNQDGTGIELNRHDMGSFLGITTETASRIMADLKRRGAVTDLPAGNAFRCDRELLTRIANPS